MENLNSYSNAHNNESTEQRSSSIDSGGAIAEPQREATTLNPMNNVQSSEIEWSSAPRKQDNDAVPKNINGFDMFHLNLKKQQRPISDSLDIKKNTPIPTKDINVDTKKSGEDSNETPMQREAAAYNKPPRFFGDSNSTRTDHHPSRSLLDQDALHRGYIATSPYAGGRPRRSSVYSGPASSHRRSSAVSNVNEFLSKKEPASMADHAGENKEKSLTDNQPFTQQPANHSTEDKNKSPEPGNTISPVDEKESLPFKQRSVEAADENRGTNYSGIAKGASATSATAAAANLFGAHSDSATKSSQGTSAQPTPDDQIENKASDIYPIALSRNASADQNSATQSETLWHDSLESPSADNQGSTVDSGNGGQDSTTDLTNDDRGYTSPTAFSQNFTNDGQDRPIESTGHAQDSAAISENHDQVMSSMDPKDKSLESSYGQDSNGYPMAYGQYSTATKTKYGQDSSSNPIGYGQDPINEQATDISTFQPTSDRMSPKDPIIYGQEPTVDSQEQPIERDTHVQEPVMDPTGHGQDSTLESSALNQSPALQSTTFGQGAAFGATTLGQGIATKPMVLNQGSSEDAMVEGQGSAFHSTTFGQGSSVEPADYGQSQTYTSGQDRDVESADGGQDLRGSANYNGEPTINNTDASMQPAVFAQRPSIDPNMNGQDSFTDPLTSPVSRDQDTFTKSTFDKQNVSVEPKSTNQDHPDQDKSKTIPTAMMGTATGLGASVAGIGALAFHKKGSKDHAKEAGSAGVENDGLQHEQTDTGRGISDPDDGLVADKNAYDVQQPMTDESKRITKKPLVVKGNDDSFSSTRAIHGESGSEEDRQRSKQVPKMSENKQRSSFASGLKSKAAGGGAAISSAFRRFSHGPVDKERRMSDAEAYKQQHTALSGSNQVNGTQSDETPFSPANPHYDPMSGDTNLQLNDSQKWTQNQHHIQGTRSEPINGLSNDRAMENTRYIPVNSSYPSTLDTPRHEELAGSSGPETDESMNSKQRNRLASNKIIKAGPDYNPDALHSGDNHEITQPKNRIFSFNALGRTHAFGGGHAFGEQNVNQPIEQELTEVQEKDEKNNTRKQTRKGSIQKIFGKLFHKNTSKNI